ncbi:unnamed protein product [Rangifer tarandus platyrhynchus]|uniref:Uncharacterized protein n=1 Tax=Rangifer tarandus platyrhynchus TaxID=3082113 RepID=A0AC60A9G9_RANTA
MGSHEREGPRSTKGAARSPVRVHRIPGLRLHTGLRLLPPEGQGDVAVWPASEEAALPSDPPVSSSPGGGPASKVRHLSGELRASATTFTPLLPKVTTVPLSYAPASEAGVFTSSSLSPPPLASRSSASSLQLCTRLQRGY